MPRPSVQIRVAGHLEKSGNPPCGEKRIHPANGTDNQPDENRRMKIMTEERLIKDALKGKAVRRERACSAYEDGRRDALKAAEAEAARLKATRALEIGREIARYEGVEADYQAGVASTLPEMEKMGPGGILFTVAFFAILGLAVVGAWTIIRVFLP